MSHSTNRRKHCHVLMQSMQHWVMITNCDSVVPSRPEKSPVLLMPSLFETTPTLVLLSLHLLEEAFGTGPGKFGYTHCVSVNRKQGSRNL